MPRELEITLIVLGSILGVWILLLIVDLIFVGSYSTLLKKHKKAMTLIMYTKLENMKRLYAIVKQSGVEIDNRIFALLSDIDLKDFDDPTSQAFEKSKNNLMYINDELLFLVNQHPEMKDNLEFIQTKKNIVESEIIFRNNVVMYNADTLGYNYWIRFLPCAFIFIILKVKKKDIIS